MWYSQQIRQQFIDFFIEKGHVLVPSSSLVAHNDPSLMFAAAGMVPFKDIFTGLENPKHSKIVSVQKCLRAGGKHNDLENVGYTNRHHTFFEMMGNFSFGDYFKSAAIEYAWELLTKNFGLSKDKLYITVYAKDDEARKLWKKIANIDDSQIIPIATDDNFWSAGNTGPRGPCSEIFYDHGEKISGGLPGSKNEDGNRFVEIWNLVFMQYDMQENGKMIELKNVAIDTGIGLERLTAVLQGLHNNYDTDLFKPIINEATEIIGKKDDKSYISYRVIADHVRSICFLLSEGITPTNEGRGYVLRRIIRRAMRHVHLLNANNKDLLEKLIPIVINKMEDAYPELNRAKNTIFSYLQREQQQFSNTLAKGLKLLQEIEGQFSTSRILPGEIAFKLYDTYGFPLDLTQDIMHSKKWIVDTNGFEKAMNQQKTLARKGWTGSGEKKDDEVWFALANKNSATKFLGYKDIASNSQIQQVVSIENKLLTQANDECWVVVDKTPFYAQSGGQVSDIGKIIGDNFTGKVIDCQKMANSLYAHRIKIIKGTLSTNDNVKLLIDDDNRKLIRGNHSGTHLLHYVLRDLVSDVIQQKGSMVNAEKLRFDFSHDFALTDEQIILIENKINELIRQNLSVQELEKNLNQALQEGATALFSEKYSSTVRVIEIGSSQELCGGLHVLRTGDIGAFRITKENSISSGIRRIEAVTGQQALIFSRCSQKTIQDLAKILKTSSDKLEIKITQLKDSNEQLTKEIANLKKQKISNDEVFQLKKIKDISLYTQILSTNYDSKQLKSLADEVRTKHNSDIIILGLLTETKGSIVISVNKKITEKFNANLLAQQAGEILGGNGGGKDTMAQAGGPNGHNLEQAIAVICSTIEK